MALLYPTIHNRVEYYGLPAYELRENELYPTIHNNVNHSYGFPAYYIIDSMIYPTKHNSVDNYGLPIFRIDNNHIYPTIHNKRYDFGLRMFEIRK